VRKLAIACTESKLLGEGASKKERVTRAGDRQHGGGGGRGGERDGIEETARGGEPDARVGRAEKK